MEPSPDGALKGNNGHPGIHQHFQGSRPFADVFTSAFLDRRPGMRRRDSDGTLTARGSVKSAVDSPSSIQYSRSDMDASTARNHPLRSPGGFGEFGVTRPHLTRMLSALDAAKLSKGEPDDQTVQPQTNSGRSSSIAEERVVVVHEVSPLDSLPGVALKYGISMAELRKANHLWPSDPIHLRKTLYIPVEKTSPHFNPPLVDVSIAAEGAASTVPSEIRRVPASQLSFFPPSATPTTPLPLTQSSRQSTPPKSRHHWYASVNSSSPRSLSSILTVFPMRETIIARMSLDSAASSTSTSDEQDLELDNVGETKSIIAKQPAPRVKPKSKYANLERAMNAYTMPTKVPEISPPHMVRTEQMEPSPAMELPLRPRSRQRSFYETDDISSSAP